MTEIADGVRRVGWGLLLVLALAGARFVLRAQCWRWCMPPATRLPLGPTLRAFLAGDAAGNVLPLGLAASEPAKLLLTRGRLSTADAIASLAVDNLIYLTSVLTVIAAGLVLVRQSDRLPIDGGTALAAAAVALAAAAGVAAFAARGRVERPWRVFGTHMGFHALSVVEQYVTLVLLLGEAALAHAIVFEALNRVLTLAFKFVPFRVGVDEAASAETAAVLGLDPVVGVTGAVVRKVRNLAWTAVGLALIAARRAQAAPVTGRP